ncbi:MAG: chromosomal replication initiator protein DnaA [Phycisphaerae bacterium]
MDRAAPELVCRIQDRVAEKIGPQRYRIWFKDSTRFSLTDGFVNVGVPNLFIGSWIENHFAETIAEAAREVTGEPAQVAFGIDPELHARLRKSQLDWQAEFVASSAERAARQGRRADGEAPAKPLRGRLEHFVVGRCNRLAFAAAQSVVEAPASQFNPLFIHGGSGLGKTHLLQGICNGLSERRQSCRWMYVSGEEFTNQFVLALRNRRVDQFRERFRSVDVLVIDDIHFLANKRATQEEFLHTYNAIEATGRQVVLASDTHPRLMGQLSEALLSRFVCGMVVRIDPPDYETRCEILRRKAGKIGRDLPEEVIRYIAESLQANVRELEGALLKLLAINSVVNEPLTVGLARQALAEHLTRAGRIVTVNDIENIVATFFGLCAADLHSSRKTRTIALARAIAMFLARKHTSMSFPEVGRLMGNKNHSTVILACRRIQRMLDEDGLVRWQSAGGTREMALRTLLGRIEEEFGP